LRKEEIPRGMKKKEGR